KTIAQEMQQVFRQRIDMLDAISALYTRRDAEEHGSELCEVRHKLLIAVCELDYRGATANAAFSNHIAKPARQFRCHPGRHTWRHLSGQRWSPGYVAR